MILSARNFSLQRAGPLRRKSGIGPRSTLETGSTLGRNPSQIHQNLFEPISFDLRPGCCQVLKAASGTGKTLTLRALLGLLPEGFSATGEILFDESPTTDFGEADWQNLRGTKVGYVPQSPAQTFHPYFSIFEQLNQIRRNSFPWESPEKRVQWILMWQDRLQVAGGIHRLNQTSRELSGGTLQRLALMAALISDPKVLLMDEPTSQQDLLLAQLIHELLVGQMQQSQLSLVIATHRLDQIESLYPQVSMVELLPGLNLG